MEECIFDKKILVSYTLQSYRCFKRLKIYDRKWHLNVFREGGRGLKGVLGLFSYYEKIEQSYLPLSSILPRIKV